MHAILDTFAHELYHGYQYFGKYAGDRAWINEMVTPEHGIPFRKAEFEAVRFENEVARQHGRGLRTKYRGVPVPDFDKSITSGQCDPCWKNLREATK